MRAAGSQGDDVNGAAVYENNADATYAQPDKSCKAEALYSTADLPGTADDVGVASPRGSTTGTLIHGVGVVYAQPSAAGGDATYATPGEAATVAAGSPVYSTLDVSALEQGNSVAGTGGYEVAYDGMLTTRGEEAAADADNGAIVPEPAYAVHEAN